VKKEDFFEVLGELDDDIVKGAKTTTKRKMNWKVWGTIAACFAIVYGISTILFPISRDMVVSVYAQDTNEEITATGAVLMTGTIKDNGEMKGHPLMFYLSGQDIATVRFSCKNQQINFMDWTEKRDEYGNAQNFTVTYGEDESEYYYLTIDWIPNAIIRELTDNETCTIATLPEEMRNDINRRVNCETANINKTVSAACRQKEAIRFLQKQGKLKELSRQLQEMARLRMEYPEAAIKELGTLCSPPVGKSGVNHRLRKLEEAAEQTCYEKRNDQA